MIPSGRETPPWGRASLSLAETALGRQQLPRAPFAEMVGVLVPDRDPTRSPYVGGGTFTRAAEVSNAALTAINIRQASMQDSVPSHRAVSASGHPPEAYLPPSRHGYCNPGQGQFATVPIDFEGLWLFMKSFGRQYGRRNRMGPAASSNHVRVVNSQKLQYTSTGAP